MDATRIHLADAPPAYCSSCFGREGDRFVDFEAVHEGPVFAAGYAGTEVAGAGVSSSDALVLCEGCVKTAAGLVGLGDVGAVEQAAGELQQRIDEMSDRLAAQSAHIDQLEKTAATRAGLDEKMLTGAPPTPAKGAQQSRRGGGGRSRPKPKAAAR